MVLDFRQLDRAHRETRTSESSSLLLYCRVKSFFVAQVNARAHTFGDPAGGFSFLSGGFAFPKGPCKQVGNEPPKGLPLGLLKFLYLFEDWIVNVYRRSLDVLMINY
jgi:hypothetical protein